MSLAAEGVVENDKGGPPLRDVMNGPAMVDDLVRGQRDLEARRSPSRRCRS